VTAQRRWLIPAAFWIGLIAAAGVLWWSGQANAAWQSLQGSRVWPLVLVIGIGMALPVIHAWRWREVMNTLGHRLAIGVASGLTVSASLINYATPGFLGAPAKAILASQSESVPVRRSLVAIAFEQGLDFLLLVAGSTVIILLIGPGEFAPLLSLGGWLPSPVVGLVIAIAVLATVALAGRRRIASVWRRITAAFVEVRDGVSWPFIGGLTLCYWLAQVLVVWVLLWSLRLPADPLTVLALGTLPLLAGQLAPVPGGVGVREATMVALSGVTGVSAAGLLGLAVLQRVLLVSALPLSLLALRLVRTGGPR
jgi:glycosyltransferase 2 family protein